MSRRIVAPWELALLQHHLEELLEALARPPERGAAGWTPAVDLIDRQDGFVARVDLPGVRRADLEVAIHDRELRIAGVKSPGERNAERRHCHRVERSFGPFALHVRLTVPIDVRACRAVLRHGVLEVVMPRLLPGGEGAHVVDVTEEET